MSEFFIPAHSFTSSWPKFPYPPGAVFNGNAALMFRVPGLQRFVDRDGLKSVFDFSRFMFRRRRKPPDRVRGTYIAMKKRADSFSIIAMSSEIFFLKLNSVCLLGEGEYSFLIIIFIVQTRRL